MIAVVDVEADYYRNSCQDSTVPIAADKSTANKLRSFGRDIVMKIAALIMVAVWVQDVRAVVGPTGGSLAAVTRQLQADAAPTPLADHLIPDVVAAQ